MNYAIEIYNPTSSTINLSNYSILLNNNNNTTTSIPLSGNILTDDVVVLSNTNSDLLVQAVSDIFSNNFRCDNILSLELQKNNVTIDIVGDKFQNNNAFDYFQLINDPINYLSSINFNCDDVNNIELERGYFVKKGTVTFDALDLLNTWDLKLNADISGLGTHRSACKTRGDIVIARAGGSLIGVGNSTPPAALEIVADQHGPITVGCFYNITLSGSSGFPLGLKFQNSSTNTFTYNFYTANVFPTLITSVYLVDCDKMSKNESVTISSAAPYNTNPSSCPGISISSTKSWTFAKLSDCLTLAVNDQSKHNFLDYDAINKIINVPTAVKNMSLINLNGQVIKEYKNISEFTRINLKTFNAGIYFLKTVSPNNTIQYLKIAL
jgi:hypothetical protein